MTLTEFENDLKANALYETIYDDSEGRRIVVIRLINMYAFMDKRWQDLTLGELSECLVDGDPCEALAEPEAWEVMRSVQAKLKEKNT